MEEIKKAIENEISEESLEEVAGGEVNWDHACHFRPVHPIVAKREHGVVWVKCNWSCSGAFTKTCSCHGTVYCEGKMHMVENEKGKIITWYPVPHGKFDHDHSNKRVHPLNNV